jgi:hypothetical protein
MVIDFVVVLLIWGWPYPPLISKGGRGYKESR